MIAYNSVLDVRTKAEQVSLLARIDFWTQWVPFTYGCQVWDGGRWHDGKEYAKLSIKGKAYTSTGPSGSARGAGSQMAWC